jgi:hypothetical protein
MKHITAPAQLENRLVCTRKGDKVFVVSQYGPFGITTTISAEDAATLCAAPAAAK